MSATIHSGRPAKTLHRYNWGANFEITGKTDPQKLSGAWSWQNQTGTLADLADHIRKGHPFMPSLLSGNRRRWQSNANYATMLALDIDAGMTIAEALEHPFIRQHCGLGIETTSSTPEQHKFRLIFPMREAIEGWQQIKAATLYLQHLVGTADKACSDASRFYFGSLGRSPFILQEVTLPANFLEQAEAWQAEIDRAKAEEKAERERIRREQQKRIKASGNADLVELLEQANDRLGFEAFLPYLDYQDPPQGNKYRCKPAFRTGSGSYSAFVAEKDGVVTYQDPTAGHGCDGFRFFVWQRYGEGFTPTGTDFVELARDYCSIAGIDVPEWQGAIGSTRDTNGKTAKLKYDFEPQSLRDDEAIEFEAEEHLQAIDRCHGFKFILDQTAAGYGKSHKAGQLKPADLDAETLIYTSPQHRNPTTPTLIEGWHDLEGRHAGLVEEVKPDGSRIKRRAKAGEAYTIAPNCKRTQEVEALRNANIQGADTASLICGTCDRREECSAVLEGGHGFGFLGQRRRALGRDRFRADLKSLPSPDDRDYGKTALIIDESIQIQTHSNLQVTVEDVSRMMAECSRLGLTALLPTLTALYDLMGQKLPRYGLAHPAIIQELPRVDIDPNQVAVMTAPDLGFLNPEVEEGTELADLPKSLRKRYGSRDTLAEARKVPKQWLPDFLRVLSGDTPGSSFSLSHAGLTIAIPDETQRRLIRSCGKVLVLDATMTKEDLALKLGVSPEEIAVIRQKVEAPANVKKYQITDIGAATQNRGKDQDRRIKALQEELSSRAKTLTIDFKAFGADGSWWVDSRGVNSFQTAENLILVGTPYENIGAALQEYCCNLGAIVSLEDEGFKAWLARRVTAEICQAEARPRPHLRPDVQVNIYAITDFPLEGWQPIKAEDITPLAADKKTRLWERAKAAGLNLLRQGAKVTQSTLSAAIEVSQGRVSQLMTEFGVTWDGFKELLILLLDPYSEINNLTPDPEPEVTQTLWEMVQCSPPSEIFRELLGIFATLGRDPLIRILNLAAKDTRSQWATLIKQDLAIV